jgi:uncharacterized membrane-anchored protein YjiN (DUF445 family)
VERKEQFGVTLGEFIQESFLTTDGRRHDPFDAGAQGLDTYLGEHREELRRQFSGRSRWWLPGAIEERLFDRLVDGARRALTDMGHPDHELRRQIEAGMIQLAVDLKTSASLRQRGERLKTNLVSQPSCADGRRRCGGRPRTNFAPRPQTRARSYGCAWRKS